MYPLDGGHLIFNVLGPFFISLCCLYGVKYLYHICFLNPTKPHSLNCCFSQIQSTSYGYLTRYGSLFTVVVIDQQLCKKYEKMSRCPIYLSILLYIYLYTIYDLYLSDGSVKKLSRCMVMSAVRSRCACVVPRTRKRISNAHVTPPPRPSPLSPRPPLAPSHIIMTVRDPIHVCDMAG
jgi:hypothetical protein